MKRYKWNNVCSVLMLTSTLLFSYIFYQAYLDTGLNGALSLWIFALFIILGFFELTKMYKFDEQYKSIFGAVIFTINAFIALGSVANIFFSLGRGFGASLALFR